jgi:hypothetical protein
MERRSARGGRGDGEAASSKSSCSGDGRRLEVSAAMVRSGAWSNSSCTERGWKQRPYQALQIVEATLVARSVRSRCPGAPVIPRRSSCRRHRDPVEDGWFDLPLEKGRHHFSLLCRIKVKELA